MLSRWICRWTWWKRSCKII